MVWWYLIPVLLVFISSGCEGVMDFVNWYGDRIPWRRNYWDPRVSYVLKYVGNDPDLGRKKWFWGLINKPVAFCDGWHFMKWLRNRTYEWAMLSFIVITICGIVSNWNSEHDVISVYIGLVGFLVMKLFGFFCVYNLLKLRYKIN